MTGPRTDADVLIIGAGPAGAAAGIAARRAGASVLVVDRARFPRDKTCGDAVSNHGVELCRELGALDEILAGPHAIVKRAAAVLPGGERIERDYAEPGLIAPRRHLDLALRNALLASGAELREGVAASGIVATPRDAHVVTATGRLYCRVLIAADGPGSLAWRLVPRPPKARSLAVARTLYLEGVTLGEAQTTSEHYFERFLPFGYGWCFPAVDGVCNVGVYQRADAYRRGGRHLGELLDQFLQAHPERFARARALGRPRTWPLPVASFAPPQAAPGLLCAGDAARLVDPFTGEGIWHALASGMLAGTHAARAAARGGLSAGNAAVYTAALARRVSLPAASRRALQLAMHWVLRSGLDESRALQGLLRWGYRGGVLEVAKRVSL